MITLLSEALCVTTYFSLYLHRIYQVLLLLFTDIYILIFDIFLVLVFQITVLESYLDICFKISYDQKCKNCDNLDL